MDFFEAFFLYIVSLLSFWFVQMISGDNFSATFFSRIIASFIFLTIEYILASGYELIAVHLSGIPLVCFFFFSLLSNPFASYVTFKFCDSYLKGFQVINDRLLIRCSLVFYGLNLLGGFAFLALQFLGIFAFGSVFYSTSRGKNDWFYDRWFYDRYFY